MGALKSLLALALLWVSAIQSQDTLPPPKEQNKPQPTLSETAMEWYLRGDAADRAGDKQGALRAYQESIKAYRQAVSLYPAFPILWRNLGFVFWLTGEKDQAIAAYREALRLEPDDAELHSMLGDVLSGDPVAAIEEYRQAVRLEPSNAKYHRYLGESLELKGELDSAIAEFENAARLDPKDGECHAQLGDVLQRKGDLDRAESEYRKALTLDLTNTTAARVRKQLTKILAMQRSDSANDPDYWIRKTLDWRRAVAQHTPGVRDEAAVTIGSWPISELETVMWLISQRTGHRMFLHSPVPNGIKPGRREYEAVLSSLDFPTDGNPIMKRGAVLHADIAMLQLEMGKQDNSIWKLAVIDDGVGGKLETGSQHWEFARLLLDWVSPAPSRDEMVRQWYIATTAYMLSRRQRVYAGHNLDRALQLFPSDSMLLLYAGTLHETYAAPQSQDSLPPRGERFQYGPTGTELKLASQLLKRSVQSDQRSAEAHLRLGHVTGLLENHGEAVLELKKSAALTEDPRLQYYVSLFLGYELSKLGRFPEAREQFERAAQLAPKAQSPLLGLSHLDRVSGDSRRSLLMIQQVFELSAANYDSDPWWEYDCVPATNADAFLARMYKQSGELGR